MLQNAQQHTTGVVHRPVQSAVDSGAISVGSSCQQKHHLNTTINNKNTTK